MANDVASQAVWSINSASQGNKRIRRMKDWDVGNDASVEAQNEVGSREPTAFVEKPGPRTITFNIRETKGSRPEIDWDALESSREVFSLTRQFVGGRRTQWPECMVSKVSSSGDDESSNMYSVEILALSQRRM